MSSENLLSQSTVITFFALLLFLYALRRHRRNTTGPQKLQPPPEAGGAWPLIGHLHLLGGSQPPHVTLGNMADKYGPVFTIRIGVHQTLVVSSSEMAKECLTVNDRVFASRPKTVAFEVLGFNFSIFPFSPYGPYWRHARKMAISELLSAHRVEMVKHVMESEVKIAMKKSYDVWSRIMKESGSQKAVTEMKNWFSEISLNVILRAVVGKRCGEAGGGDHDYYDDEKERLQKAVRDLFHLSGSFVISDALPYLRWLDLDGQEKEMKRTAKELDYFAQIWLDEHKRSRNSNSSKGEESNNAGYQHDDFMDALLSNVDQQFYGHDMDTTIKSTCLTLILGSVDTSTVSLTWALSLLLNNREVLNKAVHELDTQIGKGRMVMDSDLKNLVYIQAIVKETLRLYPPAPLNAPHESIEDCVVGGYHVSAGTRLLVNISKIQREPLTFPNPWEFRPERFLTTHKGVDLRGQHFEYFPFSSGRRMCPGLSFGLQMMHLTLANLLHGFDIQTVDGKSVDMLEQPGLTSIKASPLHVILNPRMSAFVYGEE